MCEYVTWRYECGVGMSVLCACVCFVPVYVLCIYWVCMTCFMLCVCCVYYVCCCCVCRFCVCGCCVRCFFGEYMVERVVDVFVVVCGCCCA